MPRLPWIRLLIGVVIFAFVLSQIGLGQAASALANAKIGPVAIAVLLNIPILFLAILRSGLVLRRLGYRPTADVLAATVVVGFAVGSLTPGAAGEVLRVQTLKSRANVPVKTSVMLVAFERLLSFYLLSLTSAAAASIAFLSAIEAAFVICLLMATATLPVFARPLLRLLTGGNPSWNLLARALHFLRGIAIDLDSLLSDRLTLLSFSMASVGIFALVALQFWLLADAVRADIDLHVAWLGFGVAQAAGLVSVLPFGLGIFDGSLAAVLAAFGVAASQGLAMALLIRLAISLPLVIVAVAAYAYLTMPDNSSLTEVQLSTRKQ